MILRELREIDQATDDILVYGFDGSNNQKIKIDTAGRLDIISDNLDIPLSDLKTVLDAIDANTDTLEDKTQSIRDQLDVLSSSRASESTSQLILSALGEISGTDIITELQNLTTNTTGLATEATLIEVRDLLDIVETKLQLILDQLDVKLSTRASEITLTSVLSQLDIKLSELRDSIKGSGNKDFTTLEADVEAILVQLDVVLSSRASESTLQSAVDAIGESSGTNLLDELQNILDKLTDIGNIDFATEATLIEIRDYVDTVEIKLQTIIDKLDTLIATDFATEATSTEILDSIGQISGTDVITELQIISESTEVHNKFSPGKFFNVHLKNIASFDMNVNGSVTPVDFLFEPPPDKHIFISRLIIMIEDNNINFNKFGGISALTNGFFIKVTENGIERNLHDNIIKKNSHFHMLAYDVSIDSSTTDLLSVRWSFSKSGTYLHLHASTLDNFKVIVADNLTGLTTFHMAIQGFEVDE